MVKSILVLVFLTTSAIAQIDSQLSPKLFGSDRPQPEALAATLAEKTGKNVILYEEDPHGEKPKRVFIAKWIGGNFRMDTSFPKDSNFVANFGGGIDLLDQRLNFYGHLPMSSTLSMGYGVEIVPIRFGTPNARDGGAFDIYVWGRKYNASAFGGGGDRDARDTVIRKHLQCPFNSPEVGPCGIDPIEVDFDSDFYKEDLLESRSTTAWGVGFKKHIKASRDNLPIGFFAEFGKRRDTETYADLNTATAEVSLLHDYWARVDSARLGFPVTTERKISQYPMGSKKRPAVSSTIIVLGFTVNF